MRLAQASGTLILSGLILTAQSGFPLNILIVGDSHSCGTFGRQLVSNFDRQEHYAELYCTVGSAPEHWLEGSNPPAQTCVAWSTRSPAKPCLGSGKVPTLESLVGQREFDRVVVALGTNSLPNAARVPSTYGQLARVAAANVAICQWLGPPHVRPDQARGFPVTRLIAMEENLLGFYHSLKEAVGSLCAVIDSAQLTYKGSSGGETADGVHRTERSAVSWANGLRVIPTH